MEETVLGSARIPVVISRKNCKNHKAEVGEPCWVVELASGAKGAAVCAFRARRAGFVGKISRMATARK